MWLRLRLFQIGIIKIAERTSKKQLRDIARKSLNGFKYNDFNYDSFSYLALNDSYIVYKIKEKKFTELSIKFYSDELDKPFGLYGATIEAFVGGYIKR